MAAKQATTTHPLLRLYKRTYSCGHPLTLPWALPHFDNSYFSSCLRPNHDIPTKHAWCDCHFSYYDLTMPYGCMVPLASKRHLIYFHTYTHMPLLVYCIYYPVKKRHKTLIFVAYFVINTEQLTGLLNFLNIILFETEHEDFHIREVIST